MDLGTLFGLFLLHIISEGEVWTFGSEVKDAMIPPREIEAARSVLESRLWKLA